ncbi:unnamed protein product [Effrenium voratum]|uniref:Uncharacterized protein n=1 Tax=Effrenium voratum TaxID=2562239 RepID=A0AA36IAH5_9DINO|nr:unnamed protein product [Effrenium voratum]
MEQALPALQALYASSDPGTKKEADDDWLTKFQQTPAAWQVSDQLLSQADAPMQFRFFAAQTMRTKVQFDFYELPADDSYTSLRDSMLTHINRFRAAEHAPIHTMLAIALADLAIQMDHAWPNAVETLFQHFGQSPDSYPTLLEVLRMLPEENNNLKLMTDSFKRESCSQRLQAATPEVVRFLLNLQCPTVQARRKVLECFLSWIKFTNLQASDIAQNPLLPECFKHVVEAGDLSETATDIIVEVLRMCSMDITQYQPVIQVILGQLNGLRSKFEAQLSRGVEAALDGDQDGLLQICRIYVEVGECLVPLVMTQCTDPQIVNILEAEMGGVHRGAGHRFSGSLSEISSIPLEFWHRLANEICRHLGHMCRLGVVDGCLFLSHSLRAARGMGKVGTIHLPIRMHLFIVDGVGAVVASLNQDDNFRNGLEQLVTPLVAGLNSERERPNVLSEILDRLTTIIRQVHIREGTAKAVSVGALISNTFWPVIRQCLAQHPGDSKLVEKSCRLLKHSMRCVPDLFKPNVSDVARTLVTAFQQQQHSSYLYIAEILAHTYAKDPEIVPVLTELFNQLSGIGYQCLISAKDRLEEITELVEDFFGMFERYLRFAPRIVLEAPTLAPTMQLWSTTIFVQQKEAVEAVIAFIESVLSHIAEGSKLGRRHADENKANIGQLLRPHALQVTPGFVEALFTLIAGVPTKYVQETIHSILDHVRSAFPQEFATWLQAGLALLPPSVGSKVELTKFGEQILRGDEQQLYEAIQDC